MTKPGLDLDTRLLSDFLYALNIARRQILSYPPGHPIIAAASAKLLELVPRLLEFRPEVTIGIARNLLVVDGEQLDASNAVYRDLAASLFDGGVAALTIRRGVTEDEVRRFFEILRHKAEVIADAGGLDHLLANSGFRGIQARGVDFAAFHTTEVDAVSAPKLAVTEGESAVLWKTFVTGLVDGTLDPDGVKAFPGASFDPELLAEAMNRQCATLPDRGVESYEQAITAFLQQTDRRQLNVAARRESYGRLGQLVERLSPELRRNFLNSTFRQVAAHGADAEALFGDWSQSTLLEALEQVDAGRLQVPGTLLDVLGKLAASRPKDPRSSRVAGTRTRTAPETAQLLDMLLKDGESGRFVPADYRDALSVLAAADVPTNLEASRVDELLVTLNGHAVEQQFCAVMLDLVERGLGPRSIEAVSRNLEELVGYFLESGDFAALNSVHEHLSRQLALPGPAGLALDRSVLQAYLSADFINLLLDGLDEWGKEQYPAIRELIGRVGLAFAGPLIDRLAEETSMSRRRLFMECLQRIGPPAIAVIVERLHDPRWYVVRNLLILLREINDPAVLPALGELAGHEHPKVQAEMMRTLLHFGDPRAESHLLRELESRDPAVLLNAARLAAESRNSEIALSLAEMLNDRGNGDQDLALKQVIIKTLADLACPEVLPELAAFIEARSLFTSPALLRLRVEAALSLSRYGDPQAVEIAERVSRKGASEVARAAGQACLRLTGRGS